MIYVILFLMAGMVVKVILFYFYIMPTTEMYKAHKRKHDKRPQAGLQQN